MADLGHLERMGRELKCPICLSLVDSAVSLGCNHVFCKLCILNSMKTTSCCPVCKVPFRRREVRPAPHMDNLVSIYKNMETAAGVNIHTTQKEPLINNSDQKDSCVRKSKKSSRTSKKKAVCKSKAEELNTCSVQDFGSQKSTFSLLTANKRVQLTSYNVSETPLRPEKVLKSNGINICHEATMVEDNNLQNKKNGSATLKEAVSLNDKSGHMFSPFFWLKEDEDADSELRVEPTSPQQSGDDDISDNFVPCFSDLKDSDSGTPEKTTHVVQSKQCPAPVVDSEMFEWTQRECSPELFPTPIKQKVLFQSINVENNFPENSGKEKLFPLFSCQNNKTDETLAGGTRNGKKRKSFLRSPQKCTKIFSDNVTPEVHEEKSPNPFGGDMLKSNIEKQHEETSLPVSQCREGKNIEVTECAGRKRVVKSRTSLKKTQVYTSNRKNDIKKNFDGCVSEDTADKIVMDHRQNTINKPPKIFTDCVTPEVHEEKSPNPFGGDMLKSNIEKQHEETSLPVSPCRESKNIETTECASRKRKRVMKSRTSLKKTQVYTSTRKNGIKKNVDVCVSEGTADEIVMDCRQSSINKAPKISGESVENFGAEKQHLLKKCSTLSTQIKCAFCKSIEETEVSGEMIHYFNGKPVVSDYNGGINVVHSHRHCTEWAPNVYFENETALNLSDELARSRRISCSCCGIKGAALGCFDKSCRKSFHFTCAKLVEDCRWDTANFVMLCPLHLTSKLPCEVASPMKKKRKNPKGESQHLAISKPSASTCNLWKWPLCAPYKWVFCCSALIDSEKEIIAAFTKATGVQVSKSWNPNITHVIASTDKNGACKRTLKVLMGILEGRWILRIDWLISCLRNMEPVDEEKFEISVDNHGIKDGPRLGRLRVGSKKPKLFCGFSFYFMGDFTPSYKGYLQDLVNAAGGTVLQRKPIPKENVFDDTDQSEETYIIYSRELPENHKSRQDEEIFIQRQMEAESVADTCGAKCAANIWLLDSIAACTLQSL